MPLGMRRKKLRSVKHGRHGQKPRWLQKISRFCNHPDVGPTRHPYQKSKTTDGCKKSIFSTSSSIILIHKIISQPLFILVPSYLHDFFQFFCSREQPKNNIQSIAAVIATMWENVSPTDTSHIVADGFRCPENWPNLGLLRAHNFSHLVQTLSVFQNCPARATTAATTKLAPTHWSYWCPTSCSTQRESCSTNSILINLSLK